MTGQRFYSLPLKEDAWTTVTAYTCKSTGVDRNWRNVRLNRKGPRPSQISSIGCLFPPCRFRFQFVCYAMRSRSVSVVRVSLLTLLLYTHFALSFLDYKLSPLTPRVWRLSEWIRRTEGGKNWRMTSKTRIRNDEWFVTRWQGVSHFIDALSSRGILYSSLLLDGRGD